MLEVRDPSNGSIIRRVACDDEGLIAEKIAAAEAAAGPWQALSFAERGAVLCRLAQALREGRDALGLLMTEEMGKPQREAVAEVEKAAWCAEHYAQHAAAYLADEVLESDATRSWVRYLPLGPVLGILPWNAPLWLAFRFCAPALMAGNPCLIKHDPHTPGCAQGIIEAGQAAGVPAGLLQALFVSNDPIARIIHDPRIHAVSFTGSGRGGAAVAALAGAALKPSILELGGSDPCVVLDGADLAAAIPAICTSRIINTGQSCIAAKRIIVEQGLYAAVEEAITQRFAALRQGDPRDPDTDVGPIARDDLRQELHRQVSESLQAGARLVLGGSIPKGPGFFYPPTILADVSPEMAVFREETFGPVAVLIKAENPAHALRLANDSAYGLAASVWGPPEAAWEVGQQIVTGQIVINGIVKTDPRLPSGGIKQSGYGRELGPHGIRAFVNAQQVWMGPRQE